MRVLELLAEAGDEGLTADDLADQMNVRQQRAQHCLDGLISANYIAKHCVSGEPTVYLLDVKGRSLLVERGLL